MTMTPERLAELDAAFAIDDYMGTFNAYPDLRAHIDAQAATIAECEANINLKADFIDATINQLAQADETIARLTGELVEAKAEAVYNQWRAGPDWVPWTVRGNSFKQEQARDIARAALTGAA